MVGKPTLQLLMTQQVDHYGQKRYGHMNSQQLFNLYTVLRDDINQYVAEKRDERERAENLVDKLGLTGQDHWRSGNK